MVKILETNTNETNILKSYLILQDGTLFKGKSFGAQTHSDDEKGFFFKYFLFTIKNFLILI
jgi:hypothetical protein